MGSGMLRLVFPQWQGSGKRKYVYDGAKLIAGLLPEGAQYEEVPVSLDEDITLENGICGYRQISEQLAAACDVIRKARPDKIFLIGGDCGTEVAPVSYLNKRYEGDLAVLWLDAHGDLNSPATSVTGNFHGMPLRLLLGNGDASLVGQCFSRLLPEQVIMGGLRDLDPPEQEFIDRNGISVLTVDDLERDPGCVSRLIADKGFHNVYVHIDLDVLDSGKCPWGLCLTPDGIDNGVLMALLRDLKINTNVVGASVVELRPREGMDLKPLKDLIEIAGDL
jgi:Arginase/agmatinase/formimionoglutamate hydrolase, arginase family